MGTGVVSPSRRIEGILSCEVVDRGALGELFVFGATGSVCKVAGTCREEPSSFAAASGPAFVAVFRARGAAGFLAGFSEITGAEGMAGAVSCFGCNSGSEAALAFLALDLILGVVFSGVGVEPGLERFPGVFSGFIFPCGEQPSLRILCKCQTMAKSSADATEI